MTPQTQFTPGPWKADGDIVVSASHDSLKDPIGGSIADCSSAANARLIASAPELLEALKLGLEVLEAVAWQDSIPATKAYLAIAKAEGGQGSSTPR